ncbi:MAG: LysR family transcriptional regulator [Cyanobacteria bacterium J06621_12]
MELNTLALFIEVMQRGNFTSVARRRNIDPSAVSRAIAKLEAELEITLYERSTRKLKPTEAGLAYYERVVSLVEELETAKQIARDLRGSPQGKLRITVASAYAQHRIVPLLPEFTRCYPQLSLEIIITDAYLDLIAERVDVAIRLGTLPDSSYIGKRLRKLKFSICASPKYLQQHGTPIKPQDITHHSCLLFPRSDRSLDWLLADTNKIHQVKVTGKYLLTNSQAIRQCAIVGMGLALLPDWLIQPISMLVAWFAYLPNTKSLLPITIARFGCYILLENTFPPKLEYSVNFQKRKLKITAKCFVYSY